MADPYETLGVTSDVSDEELRVAYRRLAMVHHPDHNGGSPESTVRFAELQEAYAHVRLLRRRTERPDAVPAADPALEARIAELERELARARDLKRRAAARAERLARVRRAARAATSPDTSGRPQGPGRPTDAELGYVTTSDSFGSILDDLAARLTGEEDR